ncbi:MAG: lysophospholipid acyltransferase family protein [Steroidobacteraceae bacterium]
MSSTRKPFRRFMLRNVIPPIALQTYRSLGNSWRYVTENEEVLESLLRSGRPLVAAFLHARTFQLLHYFGRPERGRWILMCSQSRDGEAMARVEEGLGFRVARGSSGGGGARALVEMIKASREDRGLNSCLAIDGSRGPRGIAQLGILTLAQKTGGMLLPIAASSSSAWVYRKSWDRTVIPKPRAEVRVRIGEPLEVPPRLDESRTEEVRRLLERNVLAMHIDLDSQTGFTDAEPLQAPRTPAPVPS